MSAPVRMGTIPIPHSVSFVSIYGRYPTDIREIYIASAYEDFGSWLVQMSPGYSRIQAPILPPSIAIAMRRLSLIQECCGSRFSCIKMTAFHRLRGLSHPRRKTNGDRDSGPFHKNPIPDPSPNSQVVRQIEL